MTMHTELYCPTLGALDVNKAIRAIHKAYLQLRATDDSAHADNFDNRPAMEALAECLGQAGHPAFVGGGLP